MAERQSDGKYAPSKGKTIYVGSLNTLGRINDELTRLYKRYWKGEISASDASRLASVLRVKKEVHETALLEAQIEQAKIELMALRVQVPLLEAQNGTCKLLQN
jgi:hypothetical protein